MSRSARKAAANEAFVRIVQRDCGAGVDGFAGTETLEAYRSKLGTALVLPREPGASPVLSASEARLKWPEDTEETITAFYGERGDESALVMIDLPYEMRLAWDHSTTVSRIRCHALVAESLVRIFRGIHELYGGDAEAIAEAGMDLHGGVFNDRPMRGSTTEWSRHAWGIAIDQDPLHNRLMSPWPSEARMPAAVIEIFEAEGWKSYARAKGRDAMHFQATR